MLAFIRDSVSGHVLFATTDTHANLVNTQVAVDRFLAPLPVATEVVTGPIATFTFRQELAGFAAMLGIPPAFVVGAFHQLLMLGGVQCRNLDTDSYARVDVSAAAGTAVIDLKLRGAGGNLVPNANPFDPLNMAPCTLVIGRGPHGSLLGVTLCAGQYGIVACASRSPRLTAFDRLRAK